MRQRIIVLSCRYFRRLEFLSGAISGLVLLALVSVSELRAAQPVNGVPASASLVVRVKEPQALSANVDGYASSFKIGLPGLLGFFENPPEGVDWSKGMWIVVFASDKTAPSQVIIEVASDVEMARRSLAKQNLEFVDNILIRSDNEQAVAEVRKCLKGETPALWPTIDDASKRLFDASDLSIVVNVPELAGAHAADIGQFESFLKTWINDLCDDPVDEDVPFYEFVKATSHHAIKLGMQAVSDLKCLTVGITVTQTTFHYEDRWQFKTDSPSAALLAQHPASDLALMNRFPSKQAAYLDLQARYTPAFFAWALQLMNCLAQKSGEDQKALFSSLNADIAKLKFGEYAAYLADSPVWQTENPALRFGSVTVVEPGPLWRDINLRMAKLDHLIGAADFKNWGFKRRSTLDPIEPSMAHIGGIAVDRIPARKNDSKSSGKESRSVSLTLPISAEGADQFYAFGPQRTFATTGGGTSDLVRLIKQMEPGKPATPELEASRASLFPQANVVALIDVARIAVNVVRSGLSAAEAKSVVDFNNWNFESSYIGCAVKCEPTAVRTQLQIPAQQAGNITSILIPILMSN